jgi:hypothetical protein
MPECECEKFMVNNSFIGGEEVRCAHCSRVMAEERDMDDFPRVTATSILASIQEREHRERVMKMSPSDRAAWLLELQRQYGLLTAEDLKRVLGSPEFSP